MNKKLAAYLITGMISVTTTGMAFADTPTASMDDTKTAVATQKESGSGIFETGTPDAENPNAGDTNAGPTIKVNKDKFLVEKGASFNFGKELGLTIVDETDGDMTSKIQVPEIATDKTGKISKTVKAVNSKGEISTKNIVINVVEVAKEAKVASLDDVKGMDFSKLVTGDVSSLTIALKSTDAAKKTMTITVSDGVNTIDKTIALVVNGETGTDTDTGKDPGKEEGKEEDKTEGEGDKTPTDGAEDTNTDKKPEGDGSGNGTGNGSTGLPETGAIASTGLVGLLAAGVGGGTYFLKKRK